VSATFPDLYMYLFLEQFDEPRVKVSFSIHSELGAVMDPHNRERTKKIKGPQSSATSPSVRGSNFRVIGVGYC
jgi:hypothetical protein